MSENRSAHPNPEEAVETQPQGTGLPPRLARLMNPEVKRKRQQKIQEKLADTAAWEDRRRRYLATIVDNHVMPELKSA